MIQSQSNRGFTLVEVMVVVVIMAIAAAITISTIMSTVPGYRLRAEVNELLINFKKAKLAAVKHNRDTVILFTNAAAGTGGSYQIFVNVDNDGSTPHTLDAGDIVLVNNKQINSNMKLTSSFKNNETGFDSRGKPFRTMLPGEDKVVLGLKDDSKTYTLKMSPVGNVSVQ